MRGDLSIDYHHRVVPLTPLEYQVLRVLSLNAGRVMTYAALQHQVWANGDNVNTGPVRDFVKKLRRKFGDDVAMSADIADARGVGYRMPKPGEG